MFSETTGSKSPAFEAAESLKSSCSSLSTPGASSEGACSAMISSAAISDITDSKSSAFEAADSLNSSCSSLLGEVVSSNVVTVASKSPWWQ
uniref:Uncharacterized protein n=1 Tax=Anopheles quadriannulatus TaxID=34691 RepID=A0A182XSP7_ANOQN